MPKMEGDLEGQLTEDEELRNGERDGCDEGSKCRMKDLTK